MIGVPLEYRKSGAPNSPPPTSVIELLEKRGFQTDQPSLKIKSNLHYKECWQRLVAGHEHRKPWVTTHGQLPTAN